MPQHTTFINVFDVDPTKQQELIDVLREGLEQIISHRPGFISATLFASADGSRVVNIAIWKHPGDAQSTQADPKAARFASRAAALAVAQPGLFTTVGVYEA